MDCPLRPFFFGRPPCSPHFRFFPLALVLCGKEWSSDGGEGVDDDWLCGALAVGCLKGTSSDIFAVASPDAADVFDAKYADSDDENGDVKGEVNGEVVEVSKSIENENFFCYIYICIS